VNEMLRKRIDRHLENLTDDHGYLLLDFVEFLESKYGEETRKPTTIERITEGVEDAMRAGRLPVAAIRETMKAMDTASRMMRKVADAAQGAVNELNRSMSAVEQPTSGSEEAEGSAPSDEASPEASQGAASDQERPSA
jgi:hypothetical protein